MMRRAMRHVGAVILTLAFCWGVGGAEATCRLDNPAALRAKAAASGGVRVIVGVQTPFQPEGNLASGPVAMQRGGIAAAQNRVLARLGEKLSGAPVTRFETIPYFATRVTAAALEALQKDPDVISVQEDRLDKADLAQSVPLIHAPEVWAAGYSGSGWAVAVLDTGVDSTHPFLA
ncbi:MAG TPA: hypothetical protein PK535_11255, partial [Synergistaceae bacterium]|nr:hypothetical protein [Synergistaceae bacterium]